MNVITPTVNVAVAADAIIGESPVWSAHRGELLWIDILGQRLHRYDPTSGRSTSSATSAPIGLLAESPTGQITLSQGGMLARCIADGKIEAIATAPLAAPAFRFNDGKYDQQGRLWTGLMNTQGKKGVGLLCRFDPDGTWRIADSGFDLPNGLAWSADGETFYFTDSHKGEIHAYDFEVLSGNISHRRTLFRMDPAVGKPDGLTLDTDGHLLSPLFDGAAIARIAPDGTLERLIRLPVPRPTHCAFLGDGKTLVVTTARLGLTPTQLAAAPESGSLLALDYETVLS
ncbi:SMP-30/gluconolactonase/LRE family protein [Kushneria aurantia]|uniref:SMP-30/gluconolactonase/LRE family protein n=1 Tax=Kushneria aurantia TaxID=504092 RepID=A0ABV6G1F7_9GAMM|nr:SMP-30/gluconolactonase/LRE family protein [Kushneria aurantia]